jgi:hypothetical protein
MELTPQASRSRRRSNGLARRKHRFAKRLRFLLLGLKMIDAFGPPAEKLVLALIQECIAQIWPEPTGVPSGTEAESHRRIVALGKCVPTAWEGSRPRDRSLPKPGAYYNRGRKIHL